MATKKKYVNNVDADARHHYDCYELIGDEAFHIAPFTREEEAQRVADGLAALLLVEKNFQNYPKEFFPRFIVRARPSAAHKIYETDSNKLDAQVKSFNLFWEAMKVNINQPDTFSDGPVIVKSKKKSKNPA